jgi:hypothetical protein
LYSINTKEQHNKYQTIIFIYICDKRQLDDDMYEKDEIGKKECVRNELNCSYVGIQNVQHFKLFMMIIPKYKDSKASNSAQISHVLRMKCHQ